MTRPAGKLSVNETPVSTRVLFGFDKTKLRPVVPLNGIKDAPKAFVICGGEATVMLALAVLPVPPFVELTLPVVLVNCPETAPVTVTLNWHWLFVAMVAPERAMPVGAAVVRLPPHTLDVPLATLRPAGNVSVNATPASATVLAAGLVRVNVSDVVPLRGIVEEPNDFAIEGGATTVMPAEAVPPVPPSFDVTFEVVFVSCPAAVPVTPAEKVQEAPPASVAPDKLIALPPGIALIAAPPQLPVTPLGVETIRPVGNGSVNPTPVNWFDGFGL